MADIALLDRIITTIELNPEHWNQDSWRCSTGMCVAGWVGQYEGRWVVPDNKLNAEHAGSLLEYVLAEADAQRTTTLYPYVDVDGKVNDVIDAPVLAEHVEEFAMRRLGITRAQADSLFHHANTLEVIKDLRDRLAADPDAVLPDPDDYTTHVDGFDDTWAQEPVEV